MQQHKRDHAEMKQLLKVPLIENLQIENHKHLAAVFLWVQESLAAYFLCTGIIVVGGVTSNGSL